MIVWFFSLHKNVRGPLWDYQAKDKIKSIERFRKKKVNSWRIVPMMSIKCKTLDRASKFDNACTIERWKEILLKMVWSIEIDQHCWSTLFINFPFFTKYLLSCLSWRGDSRLLGPKLCRTSYRSHLWEEYSTVWGEACYNLGKELCI